MSTCAAYFFGRFNSHQAQLKHGRLNLYQMRVVFHFHAAGELRLRKFSDRWRKFWFRIKRLCVLVYSRSKALRHISFLVCVIKINEITYKKKRTQKAKRSENGNGVQRSKFKGQSSNKKPQSLKIAAGVFTIWDRVFAYLSIRSDSMKFSRVSRVADSAVF